MLKQLLTVSTNFLIKMSQRAAKSLNWILLTEKIIDRVWSVIVLKVSARGKLRELISDEAGTVALDYGMIASILAVALITGLSPIGNNLGSSFMTAVQAIRAAPTPRPPAPAATPPTAAPAAVAPRTNP